MERFLNLQFHSVGDLRQYYRAKTKASEQAFGRTGDGLQTVAHRAHLVDRLVEQLWLLVGGAEPCPGIALVASGGFGRKELFPYSDVDLLYLCVDNRAEKEAEQAIRTANQAMWDIGLRASPAIRTMKECDRYQPDNLEFTLSLLDRRFVAGEYSLYRTLEARVLPSLILREWTSIAHRITELARARHQKFGCTIFHLEPDIKECPGGLRDYHLSHWLNLLNYIRENKAWPESFAEPQYGARDSDARAAFEFLSATRCFLHLRSGRDNNSLDWHAQDEAAARSIGLESTGTSDPAYWMRTYYRHARAIHRRAILLMDGLPPARQSFYRHFRRRRTTIPETDFVVEDGRIDIDGPAPPADAEAVLRIFALIAAHGYRLTQGAEERLAGALPVLDLHMPEGRLLWDALRPILEGPHAAHALRTMHALGILELIIPEFHGIDALVIRDSYHRYTVDEHTFLVIDSVHALRQPRSPREQHFAALLDEIDHPGLFFLALLMHDTGKARQGSEHTTESVELTSGLLRRFNLVKEERDIVFRLIRNHLEMSLALRRDIFDAETIRAFAAKVGTQSDLKMLTLMTYADIKSVNPDALTPWKAENLWQLYIATSNFLDRSVDEERFRSKLDPELLDHMLALAPGHDRELATFLEGLPQRYLRTRQPEQIRDHFLMSLALNQSPTQIALSHPRQIHELTIVTRDRPLLFADIAGAVSAWGMNIIKAEAFSGDAGIIVDTFQFSDPFQTIELNPSEVERFKSHLLDVVSRRVSVEALLQNRGFTSTSTMVQVQTQLEFDNQSSSHSTLLQVVAQDSPGLLRQIAGTLAAMNCDIKVALIDTEGEMAVDVFYLTHDGAKLSEATETGLQSSLIQAIEKLRPADAAK